MLFHPCEHLARNNSMLAPLYEHNSLLLVLHCNLMLLWQEIMLEFRAGKMYFEGKRVVPDNRKGLVRIARVCQVKTQLNFFLWHSICLKSIFRIWMFFSVSLIHLLKLLPNTLFDRKTILIFVSGGGRFGPFSVDWSDKEYCRRCILVLTISFYQLLLLKFHSLELLVVSVK